MQGFYAKFVEATLRFSRQRCSGKHLTKSISPVKVSQLAVSVRLFRWVLNIVDLRTFHHPQTSCTPGRSRLERQWSCSVSLIHRVFSQASSLAVLGLVGVDLEKVLKPNFGYRITGLANMRFLQKLNLTSNNITELHDLAGLPALQHLLLQGNFLCTLPDINLTMLVSMALLLPGNKQLLAFVHRAQYCVVANNALATM